MCLWFKHLWQEATETAAFRDRMNGKFPNLRRGSKGFDPRRCVLAPIPGSKCQRDSDRVVVTTPPLLFCRTGMRP